MVIHSSLTLQISKVHADTRLRHGYIALMMETPSMKGWELLLLHMSCTVSNTSETTAYYRNSLKSDAWNHVPSMSFQGVSVELPDLGEI